MIEPVRKCDVCGNIIPAGARFFAVRGNAMTLTNGNADTLPHPDLLHEEYAGANVADPYQEVCGIDCGVKWFYKRMRADG